MAMHAHNSCLGLVFSSQQGFIQDFLNWGGNLLVHQRSAERRGGWGIPPPRAPQKNFEDLASLESLEMKLVDFDEVFNVFREKNKCISL